MQVINLLAYNVMLKMWSCGGCYLLASPLAEHASIAMYVAQVVIHQHDRPLVGDMCQQCL